MALTDLKDRGLRAYGALKAKLGNLFKQHIPITIHLFDSLVKPILLYASDFWGALKLPKSNPVETLHIKFCKDLLGVQIRTTNLGVLLELGRIPLYIYGKKNAANNWDRICLKQKGNIILLTSCNNVSDKNWVFLMKNCFSSVGLLNVFLNGAPNNQRTPSTQLFYREKDIFQQTALYTVETMSKMHTFSFVKRSAELERYLFLVKNVSDRIALTRFRLSNHNLMMR